MVNKAEKQILEYKKDLFKKEVVKAAMSLEVPIPVVKFWQSYENHHFDKGERAHIHIPENIICITESELNNMTEEDIRKTASHEISHLHYLDHGWEFQQTHEQSEQSMFEPPPGTVGALPENYKRPKEKKKKEPVIKNKCNYHICGKKTKTKQCKYCKNYFCIEHVKPREAGLSSSYVWDKKTHPCLVYTHYLVKKKEKENEEYKKALERMFNKKRKTSTKLNEIKIKKQNIKTDTHLVNLKRLKKEKTKKPRIKKNKVKKKKSLLEKFFRIRLVDD